DLYSRPQWCRQDQSLTGDLWAPADPRRAHLLGGPAPQRTSAARACAHWPGACTTRPRNLSAPHGSGEFGDWIRSAGAWSTQDPGRDLRALSGAVGNVASQWGRLVRRAAAAIGDRARPRHTAAPIDPGRADRGHSTFDNQANRAGYPRAGR